ncbi:MAG: hypothetical protein KF889_08470 [Alphaproteobacteria bacterium]|nr:hypothetical protein [Alphaproteobacteria bacterium]MCW5740854.1 hypothetical protein [Alphaproteobacteria bacterium]
MNRRGFFSGLAALPVVAISEPVFAQSSKYAPPAVVVYHFVSPGCEDCERWDSRHLPRWLNSGEFRRSAYRRIEGRTVEEALDPRRWPREARPFAASLRQTPAFIVMRQGRGVAAASGEEAWTSVIWPAIRRAAA